MNVPDESMPIGVDSSESGRHHSEGFTPDDGRRILSATRPAHHASVARDSGRSDGHRLERPIAILVVGLPTVLAISDIVKAVSWPAAFVLK